MSVELIGIISVGVALAALILRQSSRIDILARDIADVRERLARLEGLIEGLFQPRPVSSPPTEHRDEAA